MNEILPAQKVVEKLAKIKTNRKNFTEILFFETLLGNIEGETYWKTMKLKNVSAKKLHVTLFQKMRATHFKTRSNSALSLAACTAKKCSLFLTWSSRALRNISSVAFLQTANYKNVSMKPCCY